MGESIAYRLKFRFADEEWDHTLRFGVDCSGNERTAERATITLLQDTPKVWLIEHDGGARLCSLPQRGKRTGTQVQVTAPLGMTVTEAGT